VLPLEAVEILLILPFPVWGPLLVAAALAYHQRRTGAVVPARPDR
jgi:hypothetical protein